MGVHQMLKMSLHLVCQQLERVKTVRPSAPCLLLPPKCSHDKWAINCKVKDIDGLCFMEVKLSEKIKASAHLMVSLSPHPTTGWHGGKQSRAFALTLQTQRGFPEPHPTPAWATCRGNALLSGPRGCAPEQPTLILGRQIWEVGCEL